MAVPLPRSARWAALALLACVVTLCVLLLAAPHAREASAKQTHALLLATRRELAQLIDTVRSLQSGASAADTAPLFESLRRLEDQLKAERDARRALPTWATRDDFVSSVADALSEALAAASARGAASGAPRALQRLADALEELLESKLRRVRGADADVAGTTRPPGAAAAEPRALFDGARVGVLVLTYNRPHYLKRCLDGLLAHTSPHGVPVLVSQDGTDAGVADLVRQYGDRVAHIQRVDRTLSGQQPPGPGESSAYYHIAQHYRFALDHVFGELAWDAAVLLEDDLDVAVDFLQYFDFFYPLLRRDPTLYCVSAWNDVGQTRFVRSASTFYRSDFFPGLGWMLLRSEYAQLGPRWPAAYWDEWMRTPGVRQGRACIRPEISRTYTFGESGSSGGQYYNQWLKDVALNSEAVDYGRLDVSELSQATYDAWLARTLASLPLVRFEEVRAQPSGTEVRVEYARGQFERVASQFGIMAEVKDGVPRGGYRDVVIFWFEGRRVFLAPSGR